MNGVPNAQLYLGLQHPHVAVTNGEKNYRHTLLTVIVQNHSCFFYKMYANSVLLVYIRHVLPVCSLHYPRIRSYNIFTAKSFIIGLSTFR